jgi:flagellar hook-length control protein FliK
VISGEEAGVATRGPAAATPTNEASPTGLPPTITNETIAPGPSAPSSPLIQASATQAAPATASASLPPAVQAQIAASPHSAAFGPELGAQITTFARHGIEHARLHLNPADMGPVMVQIQLDGAAAQIHMSADHPATRQALEQAMPALASGLREAGLTLAGGGVFEQPQQAQDQAQARHRRAGQAAAPRVPGRCAIDPQATVSSSRPALRRRGPGGPGGLKHRPHGARDPWRAGPRRPL